MDGMAVLSNGLTSGKKSGSPYPVENITLAVSVSEDEIVSISVENEISVTVEVD